MSVVCAGTLAACGSSSSPQASALRSTCQQVGAVLSDGPDPQADPIGYAEAQVLPLRQVHTSDEKLQDAIDHLSSAYERFFDTGGSAAANRALGRATGDLDAICPGAAS
jgi:hypothetical protein